MCHIVTLVYGGYLVFPFTMQYDIMCDPSFDVMSLGATEQFRALSRLHAEY